VSDFAVSREEYGYERDTPFNNQSNRKNYSIVGGNSNGTIPEEENEDSHNPYQ
jgi:hypothetical protein